MSNQSPGVSQRGLTPVSNHQVALSMWSLTWPISRWLSLHLSFQTSCRQLSSCDVTPAAKAECQANHQAALGMFSLSPGGSQHVVTPVAITRQLSAKSYSCVQSAGASHIGLSQVSNHQAALPLTSSPHPKRGRLGSHSGGTARTRILTVLSRPRGWLPGPCRPAFFSHVRN